ncbi:MAG: Gldg family protein, partial [Clostridia bacterium]|nr:Gldg family protein [Clostridia bacterium]
MKNSTLFRMKRSAKIGTYSFVMGITVLAVLIVANLLVSALPAKVTQFDTTNLGLTEISDETAKFVSEMEEDVTIYWLCEDGVIDDQFRLLLTRYEEAGKHIKVEIVDPLANPTFTGKYTEETLSAYSVIVESERRYTVVDFMDMYYYTNSLFAEYMGLTSPLTMDQLSSYTEQYSDMFLQYLQVNVSDYHSFHSFCGEARLTSALDYVTKEEIPHAYILTGHGDETHSEIMSELLSSMNMDVEALNLQTASKVPTDANCLILFAPKSDI